MRRLAPALALVSVLAAREASAFCRSTTCDARKDDCGYDENGCKTVGLPLFWSTSCVGFSLSSSRSSLVESAELDRVLGEALKTWSNVSCGQVVATMSLARRVDVGCGVERDPTGPNANVIVFRDNGWTHPGIENTIAFTTVTYEVATGEIFDADMELNSAQNVFTTGDTDVRYDLQSILTHELGHAIGIGHTPDPDATMFPTYDKGTVGLRTLGVDDIDALCAAYPSDRTATCNLNGRNGFDTCQEDPPASDGGCDVGGAGGGGGAAMLCLVVALARRRAGARARRFC